MGKFNLELALGPGGHQRMTRKATESTILVDYSPRNPGPIQLREKENKLGHPQNISTRWGHLGASSRCPLKHLNTAWPVHWPKVQRIGSALGHQGGRGCQVCLETGSP